MLVSIRDVYKKFHKEYVLNGISLKIKSGERVALLGANGAGKTTLIRAMLGFYHIDSGDIKVAGYDPIKDRVKLLKEVSFIPQLPPPIKLSLDELLDFVQKSSNIDRKYVIKEALKMDLDIEKNLNKQFLKLSGGMKQKLLISVALAKKSSLLLFDEPTANLDPKARDSFYQLLNSLNTDVSTIFVTHRVDEIKNLLNRKIYMDLGRVVEDEAL